MTFSFPRYSVPRGGWTWHDRPKPAPDVCSHPSCGAVLKSHPDYRKTDRCRKHYRLVRPPENPLTKGMDPEAVVVAARHNSGGLLSMREAR